MLIDQRNAPRQALGLSSSLSKSGRWQKQTSSNEQKPPLHTASIDHTATTGAAGQEAADRAYLIHQALVRHMIPKQLAAFGCGYVATALAANLIPQGVSFTGTTRSSQGAESLRNRGIRPVIWPGEDIRLEPRAAWLISVPPDEDGCPVFRSFGGRADETSWIGYLSTTGVYGDLNGGWAFEDTPLAPKSPEAVNRVAAETQWRSVGAHVFRLPGIYGPGRSALDRINDPQTRRIMKAGQVFSRIHRDDIVSALEASLSRPSPGSVYNVCDDEPAPADEVLSHAAALTRRPPPPAIAFEEASLSPAARRFYAECKRVSNAKLKAELGWRPLYPDYRSGLAACLSITTEKDQDTTGPNGRPGSPAAETSPAPKPL
jgi:nucleoside-diphosphate-sugar epimerase